MTPLADSRRERYARNIMLPDVGEDGQRKLFGSSVLIIGAGGLGSPASMYLAAAGVGRIGLADFDRVELSNLQRQILHSTERIGEYKALSGRETLTALNPDTEVITYCEKLDDKALTHIIQSYDIVIDATDNFESKFMINDVCVRLKKPFIHAGVTGFLGQVTTYLPGSPCLRCLLPEPPDVLDKKGIFGAVAGTIGTLQATEAIKLILGAGNTLAGFMLTYDALRMEFRKIKINKNNNCPLCNNK